MSAFYCDNCQDIRDADYVGFNITASNLEVCDDCLDDLGLEDEYTENDEVGVYNPDTGLYPDEDNVVLEDPYFDLHTDAFNFHSGEGPY